MISRDNLKSFYKELAETYLRGIYSIEALENGFKNCKVVYYSKPGSNHLITLFNEPQIENLDEDEINYISSLVEKERPDEKIGREVLDFIEKTYRKVLYLPGWENADGRMAEFFPNIYEIGILPVNSIIFRFMDVLPNVPFEEIDREEEAKKDRIFANVKAQFEKMANKDDKDYVWLIRF